MKVMNLFFSALFALVAVNSEASSGPFPSQDWTTLKGTPAGYQPEAKNVLVVLWATWCPDCREKLRGDLPEMAKRSDLEIVALNIEKDTKRVEEFIEREKIPFKVFQDPTRNYRKSIRAFSVPHWVLYQKHPSGNYTLSKSQSAFNRAEVEGLLK